MVKVKVKFVKDYSGDILYDIGFLRGETAILSIKRANLMIEIGAVEVIQIEDDDSDLYKDSAEAAMGNFCNAAAVMYAVIAKQVAAFVKEMGGIDNLNEITEAIRRERGLGDEEE